MQFLYPKIHTTDDVRGPTRLFSFSLAGEAKMPNVSVADRNVGDLPQINADSESVAAGRSIYQDDCLGCHGKDAVARYGGSVPDLRYASADVFASWHGIVIGGARKAKGMPSFELTVKEADAIRNYVIGEAQKID